ncbi:MULTISPECIES: ribosome maturation factor RimM [unclassified Dehalobacter]|uniref:ribosome maturation factor RimM n=1 Tax=unclassified Dehalobacter TaxID=2635733 RepID=UPI000E6CB2B1|nr:MULTISPECIES: ribosome maturation factor RimM [unclassified Dehalobacter]RJE49199.1 16S rRNA processing protein RimM [Dehalobacter sp. MCB1]TCX53240.1 16S rRNA processing protein RimM [Dehalobacter sp. 14DCB1]TCX54254.1 16S rRNA processing protein RimM [Dehalobacter sp. 12DCB1]
MESVLIGEVLKPQGIKGEIKVYPITDNTERFRGLKKINLSDGKTEKIFHVQRVRIDPKGIVFLTLEGIATREDAEKIRGFEVRLDRAEVPPLQDRWYYFELEGMQVYENDILLGTLIRVQETGSNDIYIVRGQKTEFCVPALKTVVKKVDVQAKRMDVILPPGLLDD